MAKEAINDNVPRTPRMLKISGYDIMALGLRGGAVGELLWEILHIAASGDCENEEEALFKLATGLAEKYK